ncbi:MAG: MerR family transcriptional regulator [Erysipelotrichaceae bacterium]|nr:MerR family transcriptional regulator [Erysipelotrichaceae bacterium]
MKYTIKQMATLLGTTTHKLRYYQKMGIIKPEIEESTGYRFYSVLDTRRFNLACNYCNFGFSIQESLKLLTNTKPKEITNILENQKKNLENEIIFKQQCLKHINDINFYLDKIEDSLNKVIIIEKEEMIRIEFSIEEIINSNNDVLYLRDELIELSPLIEWTSRIENSSLINNKNPLKYFYGINLNTSYAKELNIDIDKYDIIPKGKYLYTTFVKKSRTPFDYETLKIIQNYIKENNLKITGSGYSSCFYSTIENDDYTNYHYIFVKLD